FVLEGHQHIADLVLHKSAGSGATVGVEDRYLLEELADEVPGRGFVAAMLKYVAPGRQVGIAAVARGLRVGDDHLDAILEQIRPVVKTLGVALADDEHG